jgi:hypothetical protein
MQPYRKDTNRLVADELERRWNQALVRLHAIEERLRAHHSNAAQSSPPTVDEFQDLAADLEAIWNGSDTDVRLKKRLVRALMEEVIADVDAVAGEVVLIIHWRGGVHTKLRLPRRRRGQCTHTSKDIVGAVRQLARICSDKQIAGVLNRNGVRTGRGNRWTQMRVTSLRSTQQIACYCSEQRLSQGWLNLTEAAQLLGVSPRTLRLAAEKGVIAGEHPLVDGPWIFNRQALETAAARQVAKRARSHSRTPAIPDPNQQTFDFFNT